ncbi:hypothetical protein GOP47_0012628 [Adiantum capillus-veneris]|uniref:ABC transporter domain-containing protein n=1 Tax=Adiantum capillus-veneris TaxID=13818 RepID=A0A9D4US50_ADICA|nr:hypothetical protein GOP47_0012628 [Adiantum capillus-veneris]
MALSMEPGMPSWGTDAGTATFASSENYISRASSRADDDEALKWAALEKLPTYSRLRKGFLRSLDPAGSVIHEEVDIAKLGFAEKQQLLEKVVRDIENDNERFLRKLRERINKVGIDLPKIEVRFEHLNIEADVQVGSRVLPTLPNFMINLVEGLFSFLLHPKRRVLHILKDVSGIVKPSRLTLLLGPPSSGKTTLMLALAGKLSTDLRVSGNVAYNGHEMNEFIPQRTSAYISQHDTQYGMMTVRETLDFSGRCQGIGTRYEMLTELSRREKAAGIKPDVDIDVFMKAVSMEGQQGSIATDYTLKMLGLDICADTMVGDQMKRGISGGQRKRVTTGEMLVGPAKALFMDEISTGLDSSTTFQIVRCLRQSVHVMDATMLVSLLQPAPETFDLFDDVILLSEGQIVYQGPREHILEFFRSMGFKCPERKSTADFLQEVTSKKDQQQYWEDRSQPYRFVTVDEFAQAFKLFHVGRRLQQELAIPFDKTKSHPAALATRKYGLKKRELFKACLAREVLMWKRNSFMYIFKTCQLAVMSSIAMTVYFQTRLHQDSVNDGIIYMGALFYGLIVIMFNGMAEMVMVVNRLPVFYKQRDQLFYPAWSFTIPAILLRAPLSIVECLIWACLTYFVIGFAPEPGRFFRQILLLFCVSQMALGMFRFLGAVGRTLIIANTFGNIALVIVFVMGGFVISRESIRGWWIWAYWSSPLTYGLQALFANEFHADRWRKPYTGNLDADTLGDAILISRGFFTHKKWYWLGIGVLIAFAVVFNILFTLAMTYLKPLGKPQAILPDDDAEEKHSAHRESRSPYYNRGQNGELAGIDLPTIRPSIPSSGQNNDVEIGTNNRRRGMLLPFQPLSIAFNAVNYYVDMPPEMKNQGVTENRLQLLHDVSGAFRPRVLTALVGVSGAGKSTLMDVLAGRKTGGYIEGDISISGHPKKQETFARIAGYCEQNDIHSPNVTVRESLEYSAWLRLSSEVDKRTKKMFVEEVMELVELFPIADALVGLPGINGLSTEQRKRLTIAVELVANPSIIFMDEPTSGLDARAAAIVMRTVRNTVDTGRTVVCTIHQPSIDIFESFDELLLMKRGGRVIYAGPLGTCSAELIKYFEDIPGIQPITDGYNPATWMLEISSHSAEARLQVDFAQIYKDSTLYKRNQALIKELSTPLPDSKDLFFPTEYPQSFPEQCLSCLWKQHKSYWRNPHYNAVRLLFTTAVGLIFGTIYWRLGQKTSTTSDLFNIFGALYSISLFMGYQNANTVQPVVAIERTVFYRERGAGMYSALAYAFAQAAIEIPYCFTQTTIYVLLTYGLINFYWSAAKFFYYYYFIFFSLITFTYFGFMTVAITPDVYISTIITAGFMSLWNLFSGFMIPRVRIPQWWRWYYWADPLSWSLYGLIGSQLSDVDSDVMDPDAGRMLVKDYLNSVFGFKHDFLGAVAGAHLGFTLLFIFVFAYGIKKLNFQKR